MKELDLLRKENRELKDSIAILNHKNTTLQQENKSLIQELKGCHDDTCRIINMLTALKKDIRRYEVQINSLKSENVALKNKFAKIENNFIGDLALKTYRTLREVKRRLTK